MNTVLLGWLGGPEMIFIGIAIILLFGAKKIPQLMRGLGSGVKEFKDGLKEGESEASEKKDSEQLK